MFILVSVTTPFFEEIQYVPLREDCERKWLGLCICTRDLKAWKQPMQAMIAYTFPFPAYQKKTLARAKWNTGTYLMLMLLTWLSNTFLALLKFMFSVLLTDNGFPSVTVYCMDNYFCIGFLFPIHHLISMTNWYSCTLNRANRNFW